MGMIANYIMLEEREIIKIKSGRRKIEDVLYKDEIDENKYLDIDKAWHAIHYLLCGHPWEGSGPLFNIVLGGRAVNDEDVGYGPARFLTAEEVKEAYEEIKGITCDDLKQKFNYKELLERDIYPLFDSEEDFDYIAEYFGYLKDFFRRAAESGMAVLLYLN